MDSIGFMNEKLACLKSWQSHGWKRLPFMTDQVFTMSQILYLVLRMHLWNWKIQSSWSLSSGLVQNINKFKKITVQYGIGLSCGDVVIRKKKKGKHSISVLSQEWLASCKHYSREEMRASDAAGEGSGGRVGSSLHCGLDLVKEALRCSLKDFRKVDI